MTFMDDYEVICAKKGADAERVRIVQLIATLPVSECNCERYMQELNYHGPDCRFDLELGYRTQVLKAIAGPSALSEATDGRAPVSAGGADASAAVLSTGRTGGSAAAERA